MLRRSIISAQRSCRLLLRASRSEPEAALAAISSTLTRDYSSAHEGSRQDYHKHAAWLVVLGGVLSWTESRCDSSGDHGALTDARIKVMRIWNEVNQDLDRMEASLPLQAASPRVRSPDVSLKGGQISIRFRTREGANVNDLLVDLVAQIGRKSPGTAVRDGQLVIEVAECNAAQVINLRNSDGNGMSVHVHVPKHSSRAPELEFRCSTQVPLGEDELRILASSLRAANGLTTGDNWTHFRGGSAFFADADPFELFSRHLGSALRGELQERLHSQFGGFFDELERLGLPPQPDEGSAEGSFEELATIAGAEQAEGEGPASGVDLGSPEANAAARRLEKLGAVVYPPADKETVDWGVLAGYEEQKEQISDTLLLALLHPEVYDEVASRTRKQKASNRPRAVLFEGPPGCGKTTSARVLATQASAPLVYVPLEAIASKWYGESERNLAEIFKAAEELNGCLIFLDEIDSLATQRSSEMHEATRRILGVLLRQLDGFEGHRSIVIGATNRKADLDPALLSRFDAAVFFGLPSLETRQQILKQYAQQLSEAEVRAIAQSCGEMSGRDLKSVCEQAERRIASKIIRGDKPRGALPGLEHYLEAARSRRKAKALEQAQPRRLTGTLLE